MGCGRYCEQVDLESKIAEKFKDLQFSDEFINIVINKTKHIFLDRRKRYDGRRQALVNKRTALEGKRKTAEDKLFDGVIQDADFTRIRKEITTQMTDIDDDLLGLEDQRDMNVDVAQEVLLLARDIYHAYTKASFDLKRQYLAFFWEHFEVADGVIVTSVPSPLFAELLQAEEAFYKTPKTEKAQNNGFFQGGILSDLRLRGWDSNPQLTP